MNSLGSIDEHDMPVDLVPVAEWRAWCAYWNGLTEDQRREEIATMNMGDATGGIW